MPTRLSVPSATASTGLPNGGEAVVALVRADLGARRAEVVGAADVAVDGEDEAAAREALRGA